MTAEPMTKREFKLEEERQDVRYQQQRERERSRTYGYFQVWIALEDLEPYMEPGHSLASDIERALTKAGFDTATDVEFVGMEQAR